MSEAAAQVRWKVAVAALAVVAVTLAVVLGLVLLRWGAERGDSQRAGGEEPLARGVPRQPMPARPQPGANDPYGFRWAPFGGGWDPFDGPWDQLLDQRAMPPEVTAELERMREEMRAEMEDIRRQFRQRMEPLTPPSPGMGKPPVRPARPKRPAQPADPPTLQGERDENDGDAELAPGIDVARLDLPDAVVLIVRGTGLVEGSLEVAVRNQRLVLKGHSREPDGLTRQFSRSYRLDGPLDPTKVDVQKVDGGYRVVLPR